VPVAPRRAPKKVRGLWIPRAQPLHVPEAPVHARARARTRVDTRFHANVSGVGLGGACGVPVAPRRVSENGERSRPAHIKPHDTPHAPAHVPVDRRDRPYRRLPSFLACLGSGRVSPRCVRGAGARWRRSPVLRSARASRSICNAPHSRLHTLSKTQLQPIHRMMFTGYNFLSLETLYHSNSTGSKFTGMNFTHNAIHNKHNRLVSTSIITGAFLTPTNALRTILGIVLHRAHVIADAVHHAHPPLHHCLRERVALWCAKLTVRILHCMIQYDKIISRTLTPIHLFPDVQQTQS